MEIPGARAHFVVGQKNHLSDRNMRGQVDLYSSSVLVVSYQYYYNMIISLISLLYEFLSARLVRGACVRSPATLMIVYKGGLIIG